jgi:aryl-alcohol dehydrogenase-like predicted oxidoreductase
MRYRQLGRSGLTVSVVGIGCNSFGLSCDEPATKAIVDMALEQGITFFDAAPHYGAGHCETFLGNAIAGRRDQVVISTKVGGFTTRSAANAPGSRRSILRVVEGSLERLRTDFIDLLYLHQPDNATPIEETLGAMVDLVRAGKVRYIASSNLKAWQIVEAEWIARQAGGVRFVASQNAYSLIDRHVELEIAPVCERYGIGLIPYFPLAAGLLTGAFKRGGEPRPGGRLASRPEIAQNAAALDAMEALQAFAQARDLSIVDVAIGGLAAKAAVGSVIAGVSTTEQVITNARASRWVPSGAEAAELEAISPPQKYIPLGSRTGSRR